ncbi:MAG TPA: hypothetical protein PKY82_33455, partial [Pyrinomonadaceae bacterium]|nr:hypothetical protein [Pyrinomonadaceae bacterium]
FILSTLITSCQGNSTEVYLGVWRHPELDNEFKIEPLNQKQLLLIQNGRKSVLEITENGLVIQNSNNSKIVYLKDKDVLLVPTAFGTTEYVRLK